MSKCVWIFNHYAQSPHESGIMRHYFLAMYLKELGWDVYIIAASVDHHRYIQRLNANEKFRLDTCEEVPYLWLKTPEYEGNGIMRIINMFAYTFQVLIGRWKQSIKPPDIIIGSSGHPLAAWSASVLAKRYKVPFIAEIRDLWPETLIAMGTISRNGLMAKMLRALEGLLYKRAVRIISVLPHAKDFIEAIGGKGKVEWIPNGADISNFCQFPYPPDNREFTIMYFGAHGRANALDCVIDAMELLQHRNLPLEVRLRMVGSGASKKQLIEKVQANNIKNIQFDDPVQKSDIPALAAQADAFIISVKNCPELYKFGVSMNKLYDYMAAARPVVIAINSSNNPIQEAGAGITVDPENPVVMADAIYAISQMTVEQRRKLGENGRKYVEKNHDHKMLAQRLDALLEQAIRDFN